MRISTNFAVAIGGVVFLFLFIEIFVIRFIIIFGENVSRSCRCCLFISRKHFPCHTKYFFFILFLFFCVAVENIFIHEAKSVQQISFQLHCLHNSFSSTRNSHFSYIFLHSCERYVNFRFIPFKKEKKQTN